MSSPPQSSAPSATLDTAERPLYFGPVLLEVLQDVRHYPSIQQALLRDIRKAIAHARKLAMSGQTTNTDILDCENSEVHIAVHANSINVFNIRLAFHVPFPPPEGPKGPARLFVLPISPDLATRLLLERRNRASDPLYTLALDGLTKQMLQSGAARPEAVAAPGYCWDKVLSDLDQMIIAAGQASSARRSWIALIHKATVDTDTSLFAAATASPVPRQAPPRPWNMDASKTCSLIDFAQAFSEKAASISDAIDLKILDPGTMQRAPLSASHFWSYTKYEQWKKGNQTDVSAMALLLNHWSNSVCLRVTGTVSRRPRPSILNMIMNCFDARVRTFAWLEWLIGIAPRITPPGQWLSYSEIRTRFASARAKARTSTGLLMQVLPIPELIGMVHQDITTGVGSDNAKVSPAPELARRHRWAAHFFSATDRTIAAPCMAVADRTAYSSVFASPDEVPKKPFLDTLSHARFAERLANRDAILLDRTALLALLNDQEKMHVICRKPESRVGTQDSIWLSTRQADWSCQPRKTPVIQQDFQ